MIALFLPSDMGLLRCIIQELPVHFLLHFLLPITLTVTFPPFAKMYVMYGEIALGTRPTVSVFSQLLLHTYREDYLVPFHSKVLLPGKLSKHLYTHDAL